MTAACSPLLAKAEPFPGSALLSLEVFLCDPSWLSVPRSHSFPFHGSCNFIWSAATSCPSDLLRVPAAGTSSAQPLHTFSCEEFAKVTDSPGSLSTNLKKKLFRKPQNERGGTGKGPRFLNFCSTAGKVTWLFSREFPSHFPSLNRLGLGDETGQHQGRKRIINSVPRAGIKNKLSV